MKTKTIIVNIVISLMFVNTGLSKDKPIKPKEPKAIKLTNTSIVKNNWIKQLQKMKKQKANSIDNKNASKVIKDIQAGKLDEEATIVALEHNINICIVNGKEKSAEIFSHQLIELRKLRHEKQKLATKNKDTQQARIKNKKIHYIIQNLK